MIELLGRYQLRPLLDQASLFVFAILMISKDAAPHCSDEQQQPGEAWDTKDLPQGAPAVDALTELPIHFRVGDINVLPLPYSRGTPIAGCSCQFELSVPGDDVVRSC